MDNFMKNFNLPLVNAHTHAAMIAFRGIAEDMPLEKWLNDYIWPREKEEINPEFVYKQTKIAIREMQKNGIRVFLICIFLKTKLEERLRN